MIETRRLKNVVIFIQTISVIQFRKSTFADQQINLAVVYRSPSSSRVNFFNYLIDTAE